MQVTNNFRWQNCPLCYSNKIFAVGEIDYRVPVMFSTYAIELKEIPELYRCEECNSRFTQNIIPEDSAYEMYCQGQSCNKWPRSVGFVEEKSATIIARLDQYFYKDINVLDVGCNTGILLDYARRKGCITAGVEPSLASRDILGKKGHAAFPSVTDVAEKYDVITAFDLIEHLYDPLGFFRMIGNLLVDDGVVFLLTGDIRSLSARVSKENWWYIKAPEHIIFPSRFFLNNVDNFELVSIDETYASAAYDKMLFFGVAQYIRKTLLLGAWDGLPSLGPDHMLVVLKKVKKT